MKKCLKLLAKPELYTDLIYKTQFFIIRNIYGKSK